MASQSVTIVDTRDEDSFKQGRILQAVHLENTSLQAFVQNTDLEQPVIVCCYHGHSSQAVAAYLAEQGFENSLSLDGGFTLWQQTYPDCCEHG